MNLSYYEWMLLNGAELARHMVAEGGMSGPNADKMLGEAQELDGSRIKAKKLLREFLRTLGHSDLLPGD